MSPDRRPSPDPLTELPPVFWRAPGQAEADPAPFLDDEHRHTLRRPMPVAHVLVVAVVCLMVRGRAPERGGIRKTVFGQPVGGSETWPSPSPNRSTT